MKEFAHGGDISSFAKEINCEVDEVIDLSSNINFVKPHIDIDFNKLNISPYPSYKSLYNSISKLYNIPKESIELFNGGSSAIDSLFRDIKTKDITIYSPAYLEYKRSAQVNNFNIKHINRLESIEDEVTPKSFIIFVNPSTPDGVYYNLEKLMQEWIDKDCTILIDESFLDFTPFKSAIEYIEKYNKLYILKSMTKFYASAGIRVGILISNPTNIKKIKSKEPLWKISEFDSQYIQSALRDREFKELSTKENKKAKDRLIKTLKKSKFIDKIFHSDANFIMVKLKNIDSKEFQNRLKRYKIMVRDCSNFDGLDSSYVRIAVKGVKIINK